ncbi:hypothetical protein [Paenibacillus sp. GCM10012306]|uniref:hypothetical protein n=1 Tax=Paenibacillus sp. GCM10012306 TaxID=3317342 RepID=UPI00360C442B
MRIRTAVLKDGTLWYTKRKAAAAELRWAVIGEWSQGGLKYGPDHLLRRISFK